MCICTVRERRDVGISLTNRQTNKLSLKELCSDATESECLLTSFIICGASSCDSNDVSLGVTA